MQLSIRSITLLMILVPTLLPALALSAWHTSLRVRDERADLYSRGQRESDYLADASALALLVADSETLQRLAASNLKGEGAAVATLFLDANGALLAAAGDPWEVGMARQCWLRTPDCAGSEQRYIFEREVHASTRAGSDTGRAFSEGSTTVDRAPELIGRVVLSFDPRRLASIQRSVLINSALITLGALLLAWALAEVFSRRLTAPMQRLSSVVARIRSGDLAARTRPAGSGELRELEEGVNAMADRVEAAAAELNRRVDEATAELSRTLIEREQRNRELDQALERAEAAGRAKDLFLARMSHELRTPLQTVTGFARMMQQSESPEQRADFCRSLEQASGILLALVDDILTFVKLENRSLRLERREFGLEDCIEDAVMMQLPAAREKSLELVCHVDPALPRRVIGDSLRISQVLGNLISNAIKFTRAGQVRVRAHASTPHAGSTLLVLEVTDTGIGIAPESVPQLFQPFAQADESMTRRFGGSGLGLSISSGLVQALAGKIALHSVPGAGTSVRVEIPLALADEAEVVPAPELPRLRVALACRADSPHFEVLRDYLASCFVLDLVHDATDAAALRAASVPPELVLVLEDPGHPCTAGWFDPAVPVLRLHPLAVVTDAAQPYLEDSLALPLRRRDLVHAILRRAGWSDRVGEERSGTVRAERPHVDLGCMIVEDNELNRRMIAAQLRDYGAQVTEAGSAAQALAQLEVELPELLLLDVHMPEMDGITLAARVRQRYPDLPVYALTANVIGSEESALAAVGVRGVLYKPIDEAKLVAVLQRHVREPGEWEIVVPAGIGREEVARELQRLLAAAREQVAAGDLAAGAEEAHQLLGAARMFTCGGLQAQCLALESALRAGTARGARATLARIARMLARDAPAQESGAALAGVDAG